MFRMNEGVFKALKLLSIDDQSRIYIIGTGYSGIIAEYLYKKLLGKGLNVTFSTGGDSDALFLNNLSKIDLLICISKSGQTPMITEKAKKASLYDVPILSITQDIENNLSKFSNYSLRIDDSYQFDWQNQHLNIYFPMELLLIEYLIDSVF